MSTDQRRELELRRQITGGGLSARQELEALRELRSITTTDGVQTQADTSPFTPRGAPPRPEGAHPNYRSILNREPLYSPRERAAAQAGVDISTGSPVGRLQSGFAQNQALRAEQLQPLLSEYYGQDIPVRVGPESGQLEFLNPSTDTPRWTLVNEAQATLRDFPGMAGPAITGGAAVAGEIIGPPVVGAAGGAAVGEAIRRGIGNRMGVRDETAGDIARGAGTAAAIEGAASGLGYGIAKTYQGARNLIRPPPVSPERAQMLLEAMEIGGEDSAVRVAQEIERRTGQPYRPMTGQLTNDPELLARQSSVYTDPNNGIRFRVQAQGNEDALETLFRQIMPGGQVNTPQVGRAIQQQARSETQPRVDLLSEAVQKEVDDLRRITAQLPRAPNDEIGRELRQAAVQARDVHKDYVDLAWQQARDMYGFDDVTQLSNVKVPVTGDLERTITRFRTQASEALDAASASGKRELANERLLPDAPKLSKEDEELLRAFDVLEPTENHTLDLHQIQELLKALRKRERIAYQGLVAADPDAADISNLESALKIQRNRYLAETNPELLAQLELAEGLRATHGDLFDRGLLADIIRPGPNNGYQIWNSEIVGRTIGSGNPEAIRRLVSVLSAHPAGVPLLQQSMLALYRNQVVRNGLPRRELHERFIEQHGDALDALFPTTEQRVRQLGELENIVSQNTKRFEDFTKRVNQRFRGRIQDLSPSALAHDVFTNKFAPQEVAQLVALADRSGYGDLYRQAVGQQLQTRFIRSNSGINWPAFEAFLEGKDNLMRLSAVFGQQYARDLRLLRNGLELARRSGGGMQTTANPTLMEGLARATVARPLSPQGVALTRAQRWREWAGRRLMAEAIMNPQILHSIVAQGRKDITSREVSRLLAVAGASTLATQQEDE